jgi:hypothetical protein
MNYTKSCPDCGESTHTYAWVPDKCPFCELRDTKRELDKYKDIAEKSHADYKDTKKELDEMRDCFCDALDRFPKGAMIAERDWIRWNTAIGRIT